MPKTKAFLNALAIGILIFLLWDVITAAWEPADEALTGHHYGTAVTYGGVMLLCLGAGLMGLVYFDRWMKHRAARLRPEGPGAATARRALIPARPGAARAPAARAAVPLAARLGLHHLRRGLAPRAPPPAGPSPPPGGA